MENIQLSEHFDLFELTDSASYPELVPSNTKEALGYLKQLRYTAASLEEIRTVLNTPLDITSGFRNTNLNSAVKGSATSKHKLGLCADFMPRNMTVEDAIAKLYSNKDKLFSVRKIIFEGIKGRLWLHIQTKSLASEPLEFFTTSDGKSYKPYFGGLV